MQINLKCIHELNRMELTAKLITLIVYTNRLLCCVFGYDNLERYKSYRLRTYMYICGFRLST